MERNAISVMDETISSQDIKRLTPWRGVIIQIVKNMISGYQ